MPETTIEPSKSAEQNVADVPIDDLVSRAEVLALINTAMFSIDNREMQDYIFNGLRREVHNLPPADVVSREEYNKLLNDSIWESEHIGKMFGYQAEPSGDLVSRHDALMELNGACSNWQDDSKVADILKALPSADRPTLKQTDTMIIADALRYLIKDTERHEIDRTRAEELREQILQYGASMCSSAERQTDESCQDCPLYDAEAKNCPRFNKVIPQTRAEMTADRPQVKYDSAEEQIAETCDRPKGEWKWTHGGQCSECGFHNTNFDFNFCPYCGADMRGEK